MICSNCGKDFSPKVWKIHVKLCKEVEKKDYSNLTYKELQAEYAKTGKKAIGKKKTDMIKELSEV